MREPSGLDHGRPVLGGESELLYEEVVESDFCNKRIPLKPDLSGDKHFCPVYIRHDLEDGSELQVVSEHFRDLEGRRRCLRSLWLEGSDPETEQSRPLVDIEDPFIGRRSRSVLKGERLETEESRENGESLHWRGELTSVIDRSAQPLSSRGPAACRCSWVSAPSRSHSRRRVSRRGNE